MNKLSKEELEARKLAADQRRMEMLLAQGGDDLEADLDEAQRDNLLRKSGSLQVPKIKGLQGAAARSAYVLGDNGQYERIIRKRKRKSGDQLKSLMREFDRNPNWSKETLLEVSRKTGLSEAQVYKWGWDQKRKKYGPELAALMMPPFESMGSGDNAAYHYEMMKEAALDGEVDYQDEDEEEVHDQGPNKENMPPEELSSKARLFGNPTPFPNEALLEKLSNKLAQEEEESLNQNHRLLGTDHISIKLPVGSSGPVFKID